MPDTAGCMIVYDSCSFHPTTNVRIAVMDSIVNRRRFLKSSAIVAAAAPAIFTSKRSAAQDVIGSGDFQFHCQHQRAKLPDQFSWQITHNVAVDPDDNLYVIHEGDVTK